MAEYEEETCLLDERFYLDPKYPTFFKKRVCIKFIRDSNNSNSDFCMGCRRHRDFHENIQSQDTESTQIKWDYKSCTTVKQTDAYGKLEFSGLQLKLASYIRVEVETKVSDMVQFMYSPTGWNLHPPKLIISITGGAQTFKFPEFTRKAFKRGLLKAAVSTGAWIITGGTEHGVMRLVGEAVSEDPSKYVTDLVVLGIATWGKVARRDQLIIKENATQGITMERSAPNMNHTVTYTRDKYANSDGSVFLSPNHNYFILVDDGSQHEFGKEIEFRAHLESELRKGRSLKYYRNRQNNIDDSNMKNSEIPVVLIVLNGGHGTLKTIYESLLQNVPILIVAESKGCADLIVKVCSLPLRNEQEKNEKFRKWIKEANIIERFAKNPTKYEEIMIQSLSWLELVLEKHSKNLVYIFKFESNDENIDIEQSILKAFINSNSSTDFDNLKLALKWNRFDIIKKNFNQDDELNPTELSYLMEIALLENRPDFVEFFLRIGLNLSSFLTFNRLHFLYNSIKLQVIARRAPFFLLKKNTERLKLRRFDLSTILNDMKILIKEILQYDFEANFLNLEHSSIGGVIADSMKILISKKKQIDFNEDENIDEIESKTALT